MRCAFSAGLLGEASGQQTTRRKQNATQKAVNAKCPVCGVKFRITRRWHKCCSRECQIIFWHFQKIETAYRSGRADGLQDVIRELVEVKQ